MMKKLLLIAFVLVTFSGFSQVKERIVVKGFITAAESEDLEGVHIYNTATQKGTVTSLDGSFLLTMGENDRLRVTALQFQSFTIIVDKGIIEGGRMKILLNPTINVLEEVVVSPYDLSGNIKADIARVKVLPPPRLDLSYEALTFKYNFETDQYTSIKGNKAEEAFYNGQEQYGGDLIGLVGLIFKKNKKKSPQEIEKEKAYIGGALKELFTPQFIQENFSIAEDQAADFLYFLDEQEMVPALLDSKNRLLLIDYLKEQSLVYLNLKNNNGK